MAWCRRPGHGPSCRQATTGTSCRRSRSPACGCRACPGDRRPRGSRLPRPSPRAAPGPATGSRLPPTAGVRADIWRSRSWQRRASPPRTKNSWAAIPSVQVGGRTSWLSLSLQADIRIQRVDPVLPERACGTEHIVADMGRNLDAIEDRELRHGFHAVGTGIVDDQFQRRLFQDIARHGMLGIVAVLLAQNHAVGLQQPRAALDRLDLDALDVELDQVFAVFPDLAVVDKIVERDHGDLLAAAIGVACDAEGLVLGAGQTRAAARS